MFGWLNERRRNKILESEFPVAWTAILESNVAVYELLDDDEKQRLRELVQVFVAEKNWEGCDGLELDDEIRVTIAGTGCVMLLGRDHDLFSEVESILVYPSTMIARNLGRSTFDPGGRVVEEGQAVLGQAVKGGAMILAWDSALQGARDARDGRNVVIHELAHKIDFIDGSADGTPELETGAERQAWAAAFEPAFVAHKARAAKGKKSLLDDYAITNEAEYFAVASEVFFEKPKALAKQLPAVYKSLADFYKLDLAARMHDDAPAKRKPTKKPTAARKPADKPSAPRAKAPAPKTSTTSVVRPAAPATATPAMSAVKPSPAPIRKTAAMAVIALPVDLDATPARTPKGAVTKPSPIRKTHAMAAVPSPPVAPAPKTQARSAVVPPPPAPIRKTHAMAVVALPDDLDATAAAATKGPVAKPEKPAPAKPRTTRPS